MKPLLKHELRRVWGCILLMLVGVIYISTTFNMEIERRINRYIEGVDFPYFMGFLEKSYAGYLFVAIATVVILVYAQFKEDKIEGTGDFIATLPYTQKEHYYNKICVGVGTIVSTWGVYLMFVYLAYRRAQYYLAQTYEIHLVGTYIREADKFINIVKVSLAMLICIIIMYLFLVVIQYCVQNVLGGVVIGICIIGAVIYIPLGITGYMEMSHVGTHTHFYSDYIDVLGRLVVPLESQIVTNYAWEYSQRYITVTQNYWLQIGILLAGCTALLSLGEYLSSKYGLRQRKHFMINKVVTYIFIGGVTVCSGLIPVYISGIFGSRWSYAGNIAIIIVAIIGYVVSLKIARIGGE